MHIRRIVNKYPRIVLDHSTEVSNGVQAGVIAMYAEAERVTAIKFVRNQFGLGLKEAKDLCDIIAGHDGKHLCRLLNDGGVAV